MPELENRKHESLAQNLAKNMSYTEAGKASGYTGSRSSISEILSENPNIAERIKEIQHISAEKASIDNAWVLKRFQEIAEWCLEEREHAGANKALENIGKHIGFYEKDNGQKAAKIDYDLILRQHGIQPRETNKQE